MSNSSHDQPNNGLPTAAETFRMFRETTITSISALKLLLDECADLRAELVTAHTRTNDGNGEAHNIFSARQQSRIAELKDAAQAAPHRTFTAVPFAEVVSSFRSQGRARFRPPCRKTLVRVSPHV